MEVFCHSSGRKISIRLQDEQFVAIVGGVEITDESKEPVMVFTLPVAEWYKNVIRT